LSDEQVQDIVGAMFTGNTETRISATYQDSDGTIDLAVDDMTNAVTSIVAGDGIDVSGSTGDVTVTAEDASTTNPGIVELATTAETTTGTDTTRAVTPDGLKDGYQGSSNLVTTGALNSGSITSGFGNIDIGSSTFDTTGELSASLISSAIKHTISGNNAGDYGRGAEILYGISNDSVTAGEIYVLRNGVWTLIDADVETTSIQLAAVATSAAAASDSSAGMLIRGCVTLNNAYTAGTDKEGAPVYASATAGEATLTAPSSSGQFVRLLGYSFNVSDKKMFFNPDNTFVEIA
jgi:hypothetical protein